jgi:thiamine-phosphate pyrophosphorylase
VLDDARLYFVTGVRRDLEELLVAACEGGVDVLQLREKGATDDEVVAAGRVFRRVADDSGALFVVNDRPDLALRCEADGVHVGQGDLPVAQVRELVGDEMLVGLSAHTPEQIAAGDGADYLGIGPVFATPTKEGAESFGLALVRDAARLSAVPWFAIGGIDHSTLDEVVAAGATRVAVVRAIADAPDPRAAARSLRSALAAAAR